MDREKIENKGAEADRSATETCWKEILEQALGGMTPADQALETVLDRLERRS